MDIAIVVPVYNEEKVIGEFFRRALAAVAGLPDRFSFIFVNDGSTDQSLDCLLLLQEQSPHPVTIITLSRNFGHANALTAGVEHAKGDAVILIDGDLEDPPELIPELLSEHRKGKQVVYTVKTMRDDTVLRRIAFRTFHAFFSSLTNLNIPEGSGSFCLMSRAFVDQFMRLQEHNRFIPGLRAYVGFEPGYVSYRKERRFAGLPKQTFLRLLDLSLNAFFLFSAAPLWTSASIFSLGTASILASLLLTGHPFLQQYLYPFLSFLVLLQLWIIAVMLFKTQAEALKRPSYIVESIR